MRLHALQSERVHGLALEVNGAIGSGDGALGRTARPESVAHGSPGVLEVGAILCRAALAGLEARSSPGDLEVDDRPRVVHALDGVFVSIFRELERAVVGVAGGLVLVEFEVVQRG